MESHKESFVDPRARHGFCIGSLALPQQNFATLRMTYSCGVCGGRMFARTRTARPYEFVQKSPPQAFPSGEGGPLAVDEENKVYANNWLSHLHIVNKIKVTLKSN